MAFRVWMLPHQCNTKCDACLALCAFPILERVLCECYSLFPRRKRLNKSKKWKCSYSISTEHSIGRALSIETGWEAGTEREKELQSWSVSHSRQASKFALLTNSKNETNSHISIVSVYAIEERIIHIMFFFFFSSLQPPLLLVLAFHLYLSPFAFTSRK